MRGHAGQWMPRSASVVPNLGSQSNISGLEVKTLSKINIKNFLDLKVWWLPSNLANLGLSFELNFCRTDFLASPAAKSQSFAQTCSNKIPKFLRFEFSKQAGGFKLKFLLFFFQKSELLHFHNRCWKREEAAIKNCWRLVSLPTKCSTDQRKWK